MKTEYIKKSDAMECVQTVIQRGGYLAAAIESVIREAPAADVQPVVRGTWKSRKGWSRFVCSECSHESGSETYFCPNCGADMRPEQRKEK